MAKKQEESIIIKPIVFKIDIKKCLLPQGRPILHLVIRDEFKRWVGNGGCYISHKPNEDGNYFFYAFNEILIATYEQKGDKL